MRKVLTKKEFELLKETIKAALHWQYIFFLGPDEDECDTPKSLRREGEFKRKRFLKAYEIIKRLRQIPRRKRDR